MYNLMLQNDHAKRILYNDAYTSQPYKRLESSQSIFAFALYIMRIRAEPSCGDGSWQILGSLVQGETERISVVGPKSRILEQQPEHLRKRCISIRLMCAVSQATSTHVCLHILPSPVLESEFSPLFGDSLGKVIAALVAAVWRADEERHDVVQVRVVELHWLSRAMDQCLAQ